jgi:hypothetical protein
MLVGFQKESTGGSTRRLSFPFHLGIVGPWKGEKKKKKKVEAGKEETNGSCI